MTMTTARSVRPGPFIAAVLAAGAILLTGCTGTVGPTSVEAAMPVAAGTSAAPAAASAAPEGDANAYSQAETDGAAPASGAPAAAAGKPAVAPPVLTDRQIIRTATLTIEKHLAPTILDAKTGKTDVAADERKRVEASRSLAQQVMAAGAAVGGYRSEVQGDGSSISITMKVPVDKYESVLTGLNGLKDVEISGLAESTSDVTAEVVDLQARVGTMRDSVDRMRKLLAQAKTVAEILSIETELTNRIADLESLEQQVAALSNQAALSTITVSIATHTDPIESDVVEAVPPQDRSGFLGGLDDGWAVAKDFGLWVATVAGALVPFLPVIAMLAGLVWLLRRKGIRRPAVQPATATDGAAE